MAKPKKNQQQVTITIDTAATTLPAVTAKYQALLPFLGTAKFSSKAKGEERKFGGVLQLQDCIGQLGRIYDCLYGNKGVERKEDWAPTEAQRKQALAIRKQLDKEWRAAKAVAKGNEDRFTLDGVEVQAKRYGRRRDIRDRKTGDLVGFEQPVTLEGAHSATRIATDKLERHRRNGEALKAWAAAQGIDISKL